MESAVSQFTHVHMTSWRSTVATSHLVMNSGALLLDLLEAEPTFQVKKK